MKKIKNRINVIFNKIILSFSKMQSSRIIVIGFALIILIGALLLSLPISISSGQKINFIDALFTATSAVCITGLTVVDTGTFWSLYGQIIIMFLIQIGGLGFMTIGVLFALIAKKKIKLKDRIILQESLNQFDLSGVVSLVRNVLLLTFLIEGVGTILLSLVFIPQLGFVEGLYYSLFHSISAFCNSGFDLMGSISGEFTSITSYYSNPIVVLTIGMLIILGGLGFTVILDIFKKKDIKKISIHSKIVLISTIVLILLGFIFIFTIEFYNENTIGNLSFKEKILSSLFQSITTRTAGFSTIEISLMHESILLIMMILMFIGASPASTGGGIKTTTLAIILLSIKAFILGKEDVEVFNRRIDIYTIRKSVCILFLGVMSVIGGTILLSIIEPEFNLLESGFEVVSAFTTAGISIKGTYNLNVISKIIIMIFMFIGRVGSLTVFVALASKNTIKPTRIRYPEEKVLVG